MQYFVSFSCTQFFLRESLADLGYDLPVDLEFWEQLNGMRKKKNYDQTLIECDSRTVAYFVLFVFRTSLHVC